MLTVRVSRKSGIEDHDPSQSYTHLIRPLISPPAQSPPTAHIAPEPLLESRIVVARAPRTHRLARVFGCVQQQSPATRFHAPRSRRQPAAREIAQQMHGTVSRDAWYTYAIRHGGELPAPHFDQNVYSPAAHGSRAILRLLYRWRPLLLYGTSVLSYSRTERAILAAMGAE